MKQFNLDEYLANPTKKLITRDGRNVRIICTDAKTYYPIIALAENTDGTTEQCLSFIKNGKYFDNRSSVEDLFFAPEKHEGWLNLFKDTLGIIYGGCVYTSKDEAKEEHPTDRESHVATIKIEWEE